MSLTPGEISIQRLLEERHKTIHRMRVATGKEKADLLLKNCRVLNVYSGEILEADIAIAGERIAAVRPGLSGIREADCKGSYALPGLVEPHMHIETTLVSPRQLARAIVPTGTTTLFADGTDVSYIQGTRSIRALFDSTRSVPMHVFLEAPSYSAFLPEIQTTGGPIGVEQAREMVTWPEAVSLGEIVAAKVLTEEADYIDKMNIFRLSGKRLNGHTFVDGEEGLDGFVSTGITDDHTTERPEQILPRLRRGMTLFLTEAPGRRNLAGYLRYISAHHIPTERICFCIDNTTIIDIVDDRYGYLDYLVRLAIGLDIHPVDAVKMASLNAARYFKLDGEVGSLAPGRFADIVLVDDLKTFQPRQVYFKGALAAEDGVLLENPPAHIYPDDYLHSIQLHPNLSLNSLHLKAKNQSGTARVRVLEFSSADDQAPNLESFANLPVKNGIVYPDLEQDIVRLCVVERYGKNGNVGQGFCKGSGLKRGAIALSLSISDSNIVVLGCDYESMWHAVQEVARIQGGVAVVDGEVVLDSFSLPLGGQMTDEPFEIALDRFRELVKASRSLGCRITNPILTLASTVLMSVPALGLTDSGYVDAITGKVVPTLLD